MSRIGRKNADDALLMALACGATVDVAAQKASVSKRTVSRRLGDKAFQARLNEIRRDMIQRAAAMLTASAMEAVKTLLDLQKGSAPAAVRLGAARSILEFGVKLRETAELEVRIAVLETQLGQVGVTIAA